MSLLDRPTFIGPDIDFRSRTGRAPYGSMLTAARRSLGGSAPRLLVTSFLPLDQPGIIVPILRRLAEPGASVAPVRAFSVEASMSASLSNVSALALVVQPVIADDYGRSGEVDVDALAADLRELVLRAYPEPDLVQVEPPDIQFAADVEANLLDPGHPSLEIDVLPGGNEFRLYAGREFREARFGLPAGRESSAVACADIIRTFARALADEGAPLAYLHYPHEWRDHGGADTEWLRVAYAVDRSTRKRTRTELAAYDTARAHDVPLHVYDPESGGEHLGERFALLLDRHVAAAPDPADAPARVGLCVEGDANTGLVAEMLERLPRVRVYGCTMSVLYGHTICNLVIDAPTASVVLGEHRLPGTLRAKKKAGRATAPVVRRPDEDGAPFWVAWSCAEDVGIVARVLGVVYGRFEAIGAPHPNVHYAITRVLADGFTSAGKVKLFGDRWACDELGLSGADGGLELAAVIAEVLEDHLTYWRPPFPAWRDRPVVVSTSEPSEEPWASLVAPEGALVPLFPDD